MDIQKLTREYLSLGERVVDEAKRWGAQAETFLTAGEQVSIEVRDQEVEALTVAEERGLGLRVLVEGRVGFAYTTDFTSSALKETVERAVANARRATPDDYHDLPAPQEYPALDLFDPEIEAKPLSYKLELAKEIEREARNYDPRVKITESCSYSDRRYLVVIVNSRGVVASYSGAHCGASIFVVAVDGEESQTGFGLATSLKLADLDPARIGREGAMRAVRLLGARRVATQRAPVIFEPYVMASFLGVMAPALAADAVQKGKSLFKNKVGERVASPLVSIVDDGRLSGGIGSSPFDGEGVATQRTVLIEGGVLRGYLHNTYTAAKEGVRSTGNGARSSFKSPPEVGTTNFYLAAGDRPPQELISEVSRGLYVTDVLGMHTANPISGDFSVGVVGMWIENGEFTTPVRGVAIAGNLIHLLRSIDAVGSDLTFFGSTGAPTVRISSMSISGT